MLKALLSEIAGCLLVQRKKPMKAMDYDVVVDHDTSNSRY
jgi:hypothetical protein